MSNTLNAKASGLLLAMLRGEITARQAQDSIGSSKPKACVVGRNGVCLTHGNVATECKETT